MDAHGVRTAILSLTAPGPGILQEAAGATKLARQVNLAAAAVRDSNPTRFGFFAAVPPLSEDNLAQALAEITYALDELRADGVTLFTRYGRGATYLGHATFRPVWAELNRRRAVVFVHPTYLPDTSSGTAPALVNPALPQPVIDYPHETTRAATDLVLSDTLAACPDVRVILSHAGGTFPYLATRAAHLAHDTGLTRKPPAQFLREARRFYFDVALSGNPLTLRYLLDFAAPGHVLYGSDFPYAPTRTIASHWEMLVRFLAEGKVDPQVREAIGFGTAETLLPRLGIARASKSHHVMSESVGNGAQDPGINGAAHDAVNGAAGM